MQDVPFDTLMRTPAWQPLIAFVREWFRTPISSHTGITASDLDMIELAISRKLPTALREWFRLTGSHEMLRDETGCDWEVPLRRLGDLPRWLLVYGENQECWHCGILNEHCNLPDPPIFFQSFSFDLVEDAGHDPDALIEGRYLEVADSLTKFVFGMTLRQAAVRMEASPFMRSGVSGAIFDHQCDAGVLRQQLRLHRVLDFPAGYHPEFDGSDVVFVDGWGIAARTPRHFERVRQAITSAGGSIKQSWRT